MWFRVAQYVVDQESEHTSMMSAKKEMLESRSSSGMSKVYLAF